MTWVNVSSDAVTFADGNAGHVYTLPSGAPATGDLDVLCVNSDTLVTTPSGFTLGPAFVNNQGSYLYYRIAAGGEGSTVTVTTSGDFPTALGWSRWSSGGTITADVNANAHSDVSATATPAVTTAVLAVTGELSVAFAALWNLQGATPATPSWSAGYTSLTGPDQSGTGGSDVAQWAGYNDNAGTAAESPGVSWTNATTSQYILVQTFEPGGGGTNASAGLAAATGVPPSGTEDAISLGMTIRGS